MRILTATEILNNLMEGKQVDIGINSPSPLTETISEIGVELISRCRDINYVCDNTNIIIKTIDYLHNEFLEDDVPKGFDWKPISNLSILRDLATYISNTETKVDSEGTVLTVLGNESPQEAKEIVLDAIELKGCYEDLYSNTLKFHIKTQSRESHYRYYLSKQSKYEYVAKSVKEWLEVARQIAKHNTDLFYYDEVKVLSALLLEYKDAV